MRVDADGTSNEEDITDETDATYTLTDDDRGKQVKVEVRFVDILGGEETRTSAPTATLAGVPNTAATGAPTITGTAQVGETLTAVTTGIMDADGLTSPTYTYQWIRVDGTEADIAAANSSTYTLGDADLGTILKVRVTFANNLGHTETLTSAATATVGAVATAPTVSTVDVTSMPASGDTYGTGEMIQFTVTFDQDVTVTGTPEFEFCLGNSDGGSCTDGSPPPTRRRAALSSGSGTTALVFSYTVVAGEMDDNGIWIGDQDRTIKLDTGDAIRGTVGGLDAVLTHPSGGAQTGHKVNGGAAATAPTVNDVAVTSTPASGNTYYLAGEVIEFTVTFSAPVTVTATPKFAFQAGRGDAAGRLRERLGQRGVGVRPDGADRRGRSQRHLVECARARPRRQDHHADGRDDGREPDPRRAGATGGAPGGRRPADAGLGVGAGDVAGAGLRRAARSGLDAGDGRVYGDGDGRSHHHEPGGVGGVDIRHLGDADTGRGAGCGRDGDAGVRAAGVEPGAGRGGQRCAGVQRPVGEAGPAAAAAAGP